jgi:replicative superfamily II helicase
MNLVCDRDSFLLADSHFVRRAVLSQDRKVVEELFIAQKIQVLVCTATLAWGTSRVRFLVVPACACVACLSWSAAVDVLY